MLFVFYSSNCMEEKVYKGSGLKWMLKFTMEGRKSVRSFDKCAKFQYFFNRIIRLITFDENGELKGIGLRKTFASMFHHLLITYASFFLQALQIVIIIFRRPVPVSKLFYNTIRKSCIGFNALQEIVENILVLSPCINFLTKFCILSNSAPKMMSLIQKINSKTWMPREEDEER